MPVSANTAYVLLSTFGMLEFALKRTRGFLTCDGDPTVKRRKAKVDWPALDQVVGLLPANVFLDQISPKTRAKVLGGDRLHPQIQYVLVGEDGTWWAQYENSALPQNDAEALVVAMRRVRNNLFHGGKEDPLEEPKLGDDEQWALAALEIADKLWRLVESQRL